MGHVVRLAIACGAFALVAAMSGEVGRDALAADAPAPDARGAQIHRGADAIPFEVAPEIARCCLSLRCGNRQLALQLDSEQNRELIADGIHLLVQEAYAAREANGGGAPPEKI